MFKFSLTAMGNVLRVHLITIVLYWCVLQTQTMPSIRLS